jgi:uncharacterized protein YkwD
VRIVAMLATASVFAGGLVASGSARPQEAGSPTRCATAPHPGEVLQRLNAVRSQGAICRSTGSLRFAAPLRWSDSLAAVATTQSRDMVTMKRMKHRDVLDRALAERLTAAGYRFSVAVENVAVGYDTLDDVVRAWLRSEGHCDNMMNGAVLELGLACSDDATSPEPGDRRYWTLVLGSPAKAAR